VCVCVRFLLCVLCSVWVFVCVDFIMCVCMGFVVSCCGFFNAWDFVVCGCVYV